LKIGILHFHLKPGGVTTVIRLQVEALDGLAEIAVVTGEQPPGPFPAAVVCIGDLAYDTRGGGRKPPKDTAREVLDALSRRFGGPPDLLHVHNPLLAKNRHWLKILAEFQRMGVPLLLHVHDFAEDGRPQSYFREEPYPENVHYAVINPRDYRLLEASGLMADGLHLLPNPVTPIDPPPQEGPRDTVLYPVRAIRRKNIGEALLLSLFCRKQDVVAITLPPNSPPDRRAYRAWRSWAETRRLGVRFGAGARTPFPTLVGRARCFVSTSVAEGFGFAFLEPWTAGKPVWGRYIPGILDAFEENGVALDHLYTRVRIPLAWHRADRLRKQFAECLERAVALYGIPDRRLEPDGFLETLFAKEWIDFGLLDEPAQVKVLERLVAGAANRRQLLELNPRIDRFNRDAFDDRQMEDNRRAVLTAYSLHRYRDLLMEAYGKVRAAPPVQAIDKARLVERFLVPENFSLLKWKPYDG
jgi:glycosyltransferase involved in cell wall biosynthesis